MATNTETLYCYRLEELRDHLEAAFNAIVVRLCSKDTRDENRITGELIDYLRDDAPVVCFATPDDGIAIVRFVTYKQKGQAERERGDIALILDLSGVEEDTTPFHHQGVAYVEAKLRTRARSTYSFTDKQLLRLAAHAASGSVAYVAFYDDDPPVAVNPYLLMNPDVTRLGLTPAAIVHGIIGSKRTGNVPPWRRTALCTTFVFRWLQGYDLDLSPANVQKALAYGAGSYIHIKVAKAKTLEQALELARNIPGLDIPGHIVDVCRGNIELVQAFDNHGEIRISDLDRAPDHFDFSDGYEYETDHDLEIERDDELEIDDDHELGRGLGDDGGLSL